MADRFRAVEEETEDLYDEEVYEEAEDDGTDED